MKTANSEAADVMRDAGERAQALYNQWADAFSTALENSTSQQTDVDGDVQNKARPSKRDPRYLDPRTITENDVRTMLENASFGEYNDDTYIPLRRNTPKFFIDVVSEHSKGTYIVKDFPIAATAKHIRQNIEMEDGQSYGEERPHELEIDDIITISEKMSDPAYIVLQSNGRYVEVVTFYNKRKKQVIVAIDIANDHTPPYKNFKHTPYMNGYDEGYYNIVVSQYEPDNFQSYLAKNEVVYDKKEMNGKYQVGSGRIVTVTHDNPFIEDSIPQENESVKENISDTQAQARRVTKEQDTAYMDAVNRGDKETAQKMVDEAAKSAGYTYRLYHGTNADFTKFDLRKHGGKNGKGEGYGIYLAANREISAPYGKNVIDAFVKFNRLAEGRTKTLSYAEVKNIVKRSCEIEAKQMVEDEEYDSVTDALKDTWVSNVVYTYDYANMEQVYTDVANKVWKENNNDGDIINEIMALSGAHYDYDNAIKFYDDILTPVTGIDGFHYIWGNEDGSGVQNDIYLAFKSEQIKSSDPITYDDNGNVIPLSERFNPENEDIRYQVRRRRNKNYLDVESRFGVAELVSKNKKYNKEKKKKPRKIPRFQPYKS